MFFPPTAESFGVSAQIGSAVVLEVRFYEVPGFHEGSTEGSARFCEGWRLVRAQKRAPHAVGDIT